MNETIQVIGIKANQMAIGEGVELFLERLRKALIYVGKKIRLGLKRVWEYLKEQDRLATEHHRALQLAKDEFYTKNYWCIR